MSRPARLTICFFACVVGAAAGGCAQVLGIDDAHGIPAAGGSSAGGSMSPTAGSALTDGGSTLPGGGSMQSGGTSGGANGGGAATPATDGGGAGDAGAAGSSDGPDVPEATLCERYCDAILAGCTDEHAQYNDRDACLAACADYPEGTPGDKSGNSINCRLTYASKASSEPYTYCTWAGPGGDGKCGSNCEGFCTLMLRTCTAESTAPGDYFASVEDCQTRCQQLPDVGGYNVSDTSLQMGADHVECRLYHVGAAIAEDDPTTHCHHAMGLKLCVGASTR